MQKSSNRENQVLTPTGDQSVGFTLFHSDFALGHDLFSQKDLLGYDSINVFQYLRWHIGEIHIVDPALLPNLKRDDLEESEFARQFRSKIRQFYMDRVNEARFVSKSREMQRKYDGYETRIGIIESSSVGATEESVLHIIQNELSLHDEAANRYKPRGEQDRDIEVRAIKGLKNKRKRLQNRISSLLGTDSSETSPEIDTVPEELTTTMQSGEGNHKSGQNDNQPSPQSKKDSTSGKKIKSSQSAETNGNLTIDFDLDTPPSGNVPVVLVLTFLEEVLQELLPNDSSKQKTVVQRMRTRMASVVNRA